MLSIESPLEECNCAICAVWYAVVYRTEAWETDDEDAQKAWDELFTGEGIHACKDTKDQLDRFAFNHNWGVG